MKIEYTNFDGDWDADCPFCRSPQRNHQVNLGELDGVRYIHRQPCQEEQKNITKQFLNRANRVTLVITAYEIVVYLWNKIPFKEETKLLYKVLSCAFVVMRSKFRYWLEYRKQ